MSRTLTNHRTAGKGRGYFFLLLSTTSTCFVNRSVFSICSYQRDLMKNKNVASRSRNHTKFFYIKTLIRVNKGAGFLDLLLNISFQPLIIVVKHSIIKLDLTELLDPPQVFTCCESQWLFCFMNKIFVLKAYFSLSEEFLSKTGKCYKIYNVIFVAPLRASR